MRPPHDVRMAALRLVAVLSPLSAAATALSPSQEREAARPSPSYRLMNQAATLRLVTPFRTAAGAQPHVSVTKDATTGALVYSDGGGVYSDGGGCSSLDGPSCMALRRTALKQRDTIGPMLEVRPLCCCCCCCCC